MTENDIKRLVSLGRSVKPDGLGFGIQLLEELRIISERILNLKEELAAE